MCYIVSEYQKGKKITKCPKRQKQFEDKEQASEPDLDMAAMLELSDQELRHNHD